VNDEHAIGRVCVLLAVLVEEIRGLRMDLTRSRPKKLRPLSDADCALLAALLPAVRTIFGEHEFTVGTLMRRAERVGSSDAKAARDAIASAGLNALQLGHLFKRAAAIDAPISGGLYVHFLKVSRMGAVFGVDTNTAEHRAATTIARTLRARLSP
jgi:hypothetical protein